MAKRLAQSIDVAGHGDDVHVVGNQATGPDFKAVPSGCFGQQIKIERVIALLKKRPLDLAPSSAWPQGVLHKFIIGLSARCVFAARCFNQLRGERTWQAARQAIP
jgi:hypothetical protein